MVLGGAVYHGGAAIKEKRIKKIFFLFFILISIKRRNWEELEREGLCCCEGMGRKEGGILLLLLRGHCFKSILIMINLIMIQYPR